jgi:hypothetical protein
MPPKAQVAQIGLIPSSPEGSELAGSDIVAALERFTPPVVNQLLDYYDTRIAPMMAWLDSDQNGYRRLVLPMAASQPILKLAILVTAAKHTPFDVGIDDETLRSASETTVMMITKCLTQLTQQEADAAIACSENIEVIIAAVLVLSDYSLLRSNLSVAQFHREAVRTLVRTLDYTPRAESELFAFLRDDAAGYDVLACTTLSGPTHILDALLPRTSSNMLAPLLRLIHAATVYSLGIFDREHEGGGHNPSMRYHDAAAEIGGSGHDGVKTQHFSSMSELENAFEATHGTTLLSADPRIQAQPERLRYNFVCLTAAYRHAGILYACRRIPSLSDQENRARFHLSRLFDILQDLQDTGAILPSLTWLLFVAGICCAGQNSDRMSQIVRLCQLLAEDSRYEHYKVLRKFLAELHESRDNDWIRLAREFEKDGSPVVPV